MSLPSAHHQVTLLFSCRRLGGYEPNPPATLNSKWVIKAQVIANTEVNKYKSTWIRTILSIYFFESDNIRQNPPGPDSALPLAGGRLSKDQASPRKGRWDFVLWNMLRKQGPALRQCLGLCSPHPSAARPVAGEALRIRGHVIKCIFRSLVLARLV